MKTQQVNIAIIGGGFCGMITAVQLLRNSPSGLHVHIINKGSVFTKGVAYDPHNSSLLLNVPNCKMSAFADEPDHFLRWLGQNYADERCCGPAFSTRARYGQYLGDIWQRAMNDLPADKTVTVYDDHADDMTEAGNKLLVHLASHPTIIADMAILATGNAMPRLPNGLPTSLINDKCFFANPWKSGCISQPDEDVLIIGNGLTTVDAVIGLVENGCAHIIYSISPGGYMLNAWVEDKAPYTGLNFQEITAGQLSLHRLLCILNKHRKIADSLGQSFYTVIDSLRPHVQKIWINFSLREKQRFLKYLKTAWEKVRHRLPAEMHKRMADLQANGRFVPYSGSIASIEVTDNVAKVILNCRDGQKHIRVGRIINCTGPDASIYHQNILLSNLAKKGLISPDPCGLGIDASYENGSVITADGSLKSNLFVIGGNLKGVLWESTAVPDLSVQAHKLARHIVAHIRVPESITA